MKESLSSVDIAAIVVELQELIGARVEKVYQIGREEIRLRLRQKDKGAIDLVIEAGKRIHITKYKRATPRIPSNFPMYLRKKLNGGRISQIRQLEFDRIVEITVERWDGKFRLVAELLPRGNIVLIDEDELILLPLRRKSFSARVIKVREKYERPPSRANPLQLNEQRLTDLCNTTGKDVVRVLATDLNLGGLYAEEVCKKAGVEKNKNANDLEEAERKAILEALFAILEPILENDKSRLKPHIVLAQESEERVDVLPFLLNTYESNEKVFSLSFNDAVDEFFTEKLAEELEEQAQDVRGEELGKYERVLKEQEEAVLKFKAAEEVWIRKGELIYARFSDIEQMLQDIPKKKKVVPVMLPDTDITLEIDTSVSLYKNAGACYEHAKVLRKKLVGVERAMETTKVKIRREAAREVKLEEVQIPQKKEEVKREKKEWYERFRWFETSERVLVLGGKDATSNEILVKKHMDAEDLFFHTQAEGAPVVIAKTGGKDVSEADLKAIAQFAASYSSLWKYGFYEGECYCVTGEQVSKTPPTGEYIKKGSFVVRGKRKYFKAALGVCIGIEKDRLVACPDMQKDKLAVCVVIEPGGELEKNELTKELVTFFVERAKSNQELTEQIAMWGHEKIMGFLPPGKSRIKGYYPAQ